MGAVLLFKVRDRGRGRLQRAAAHKGGELLRGHVEAAHKLDDLWYDTYVSDCADRRASACSTFQMTNSGFHAEITLKKDNLVFFSVPYDDGFTAYVNGKETEVIRVDEGLMAVLAPAGENTIDFVYQADGYSLASKVSLAALAVFVLYAGYFVRKKKKRC